MHECYSNGDRNVARPRPVWKRMLSPKELAFLLMQKVIKAGDFFFGRENWLGDRALSRGREELLSPNIKINELFTNNDGNASGGGKIRNNNGEVLFGFSEYHGICSRLKMLLAIIHFRAQGPWRMDFLLCQVKELVMRDDLALQHQLQQTNIVVDSLAKTASSSCTSFASTDLPRHVNTLLSMDAKAFPCI
ncbi:hypothetical protein ACH5RR_013099 [Cinchona calisaya]|uniref:Uncharacterized protein n=1 Tax=Cinchona calisaya TaxID=153742 RepID=A0ABD2ZZ66_9GENT